MNQGWSSLAMFLILSGATLFTISMSSSLNMVALSLAVSALYTLDQSFLSISLFIMLCTESGRGLTLICLTCLADLLFSVLIGLIVGMR